MSIRARIIDAFFWIVGTLLLKKAFPKLTENAVSGWIDDKIGEALGWSAPDVSTVLSWVWPAIVVALFLWVYHQIYGRLIRKPQQSGGERFYAIGTVGDGLHQQTWTKVVEPYHVIILGLVISVGGVAWMLYRSSEATKISQTDGAAILIAPFQAQIDSLNRQLALLRSKTPPSQREFTNRTIRELRAFYEGRTGLQADAFMADEKGKLIEVEGVVVNISSGMAFMQVGQEAHNGMQDHVECRFGPQWNAKLGTFRPRENIKIRGTIGPSQNGAQIYLQDCEIIS